MKSIWVLVMVEKFLNGFVWCYRLEVGELSCSLEDPDQKSKSRSDEQQQREKPKFERVNEHKEFSLLTDQITENLSKETEDKMDQDFFKAGSIHLPEFREFWMTELRSDDWVKQTIEIGYVLPLAKLPPCYEEENNGSARSQMDYVRATVEKWEQQGVVRFVETKPHCVSPLSVIERTTSKGETKRRLCWDGSRCVNTHLEKSNVKLDHLQIALENTRQGDFQAKYDLKSAYFHIKIFPGHTKFLGAKFVNKTGKVTYFEFLFLPFGLSSAVRCMTKLFKPIKAYLSEKGIRHTIFIDDGRVVSQTAEQSKEDFKFTLQTLRRAGWVIEQLKTDKIDGGAQTAEYLGFVIDTNKMLVGLTEEKEQGLREAVAEVLKFKKRRISAKVLAKCLGKMVSAEPGLGAFPLVMARKAYVDLEKEVEQAGWKTSVSLSEESISSFEDFLSRMNEFNFSPIKTPATAISVVSIIGPPSEYLKTKVISNHRTELTSEIWCGDASDFAVCAYTVKAEQKVFFIGRLSKEEQLLSSGHRELLTVKHALRDKKENASAWDCATTLYWLTDSSNLVAFLTKGSSKPRIQTDILEILSLTKSLNIRIIPIHLLRSDPRIQIADDGSKFPDSDNWSIDSQTFDSLRESTGEFTIDIFADNKNTKTKRFYSNFWCQGTLAIDAFTASWDEEVAWICPPVSQIIPTVQKIGITKGSGLLIIPKWPTARFWPWIYPDGANLSTVFIQQREIRPKVRQNSGAQSALRGVTAFPFIALYFNNIK
jgi:hypothetical protein